MYNVLNFPWTILERISKGKEQYLNWRKQQPKLQFFARVSWYYLTTFLGSALCVWTTILQFFRYGNIRIEHERSKRVYELFEYLVWFLETSDRWADIYYFLFVDDHSEASYHFILCLIGIYMQFEFAYMRFYREFETDCSKWDTFQTLYLLSEDRDRHIMRQWRMNLMLTGAFKVYNYARILEDISGSQSGFVIWLNIVPALGLFRINIITGIIMGEMIFEFYGD